MRLFWLEHACSKEIQVRMSFTEHRYWSFEVEEEMLIEPNGFPHRALLEKKKKIVLFLFIVIQKKKFTKMEKVMRKKGSTVHELQPSFETPTLMTPESNTHKIYIRTNIYIYIYRE